MIIVHKEFTKYDRLKAAEDPGRKRGQVKGSYLDDLMALQKAILLCRGCAPQLAIVAKKYHYFKDPKFPVVRASCDVCKEHDEQAQLYLHETLIPERKQSRGNSTRLTLFSRR